MSGCGRNGSCFTKKPRVLQKSSSNWKGPECALLRISISLGSPCINRSTPLRKPHRFRYQNLLPDTDCLQSQLNWLCWQTISISRFATDKRHLAYRGSKIQNGIVTNCRTHRYICMYWKTRTNKIVTQLVVLTEMTRPYAVCLVGMVWARRELQPYC